MSRIYDAGSTGEKKLTSPVYHALNFVKIIFNAFHYFHVGAASRMENQIGPSHISHFIFEHEK